MNGVFVETLLLSSKALQCQLNNGAHVTYTLLKNSALGTKLMNDIYITGEHCTLKISSRGKQLVLFSRES